MPARANMVSIDRIENIADGLRTACKNKLDELIDVSNTVRRSMNEGIDEILADLNKVEVEGMGISARALRSQH
jgi:hypothetical protein